MGTAASVALSLTTAVHVVALVVFAAAAVINWSTTLPGAGRQQRLQAVSKLAATGALVVVAAVAGDLDGVTRLMLVVAVVCCLAGDAALLGPTEGHFIAGLGNFAHGHLWYAIVGLRIGGLWPQLLAAVPFLVVLFGVRFVTATVPGARRRGGAVMQGAVIGYAVVISAMVIVATGVSWIAGIGAMVFAVSDWIIGHQRFVHKFRYGDTAVMVTYHVGQVLLISGLAAA